MKIIALFLLLLIMVSQAGASVYFKVIDVSPITLEPNSQTDFKVQVKNLGSDGQYAKLIFRSETEGLTFAQLGGAKYVFQAGTHIFNCTASAGNLQPGNYSFQVGIAASGSPSSWANAYVNIVPHGAISTTETQIATPQANESPSAMQNENPEGEISEPNTTDSESPAQMPNGSERNEASRLTPGPGALLAIVALFIAYIRLRA
jgi:hypothetical protein